MASAKSLDALGLAIFRAIVSAVVYATGFRSVSDDDFSRVVIAMRFCDSPSFDPSGTSWLPLPFWLTGGAMKAFGSSLEVARGVAFFEGVAGTLLIWQAARWLGLSRGKAWLGAAVASAFPYAAWLGVATVPEYLTAALIVLGIATANSPSAERRALGAVALALAALCRYEAWFVLAAFALLTTFDVVRQRALRQLVAVGLATVVPVAWMLHGAIHHGSATFFLTRVANYRAALGGSSGTAWQELATYPILLFTREPELCTLTLLAAAALWRMAASELKRFGRPALLLAAMLAALMVGTVVGGAPTHHPERALLSIWMLAAMVLASGALELQHAVEARHFVFVRLAVSGAVLGAILVRYTAAPRPPFVRRDAEVELGREARRLVGGGRLLIGARDYGFFAVMAGFGSAVRAIPTDLRDPRSPKSADVFRSLAALEKRVQQERADALIAPSEHARIAAHLGRVSARRGDYLLVTSIRR